MRCNQSGKQDEQEQWPDSKDSCLKVPLPARPAKNVLGVPRKDLRRQEERAQDEEQKDAASSSAAEAHTGEHVVAVVGCVRQEDAARSDAAETLKPRDPSGAADYCHGTTKLSVVA